MSVSKTQDCGAVKMRDSFISRIKHNFQKNAPQTQHFSHFISLSTAPLLLLVRLMLTEYIYAA
jgi:hypothetical protein